MTTDLVLTNPWKEQSMTALTDDLSSSSENASTSTANVKFELEEEEKNKEQYLKQLREWIRQNSDMENCLTDDSFLLRFLRTKKYSLFMAQQMILKYLNLRKFFWRYMEDLDFEEKNCYELLSNGYMFASPIRDSKGRRVIIYNIAKFDLQKYSSLDLARIHVVNWESVLEDDETQLFGVTHVADLSGGSAAFSTLFTLKEFTRIITWGEQSFPMRHKEIHLLNVPAPVKFIYDYAVSIISKKLVQRFMLHDSFSTLTAKVDKSCLPQEMGGVMPMAEMIRLWNQELSRKRDRLLTFKNMKLLSDKGILTRKTIGEHLANNSELEGLTGTFRKLEVD